MKWFSDPGEIYLHRQPVDFRKSINGLVVIEAIFVFCNKSRDKLKILCWDQTGFVLWYKRLEKSKFKWPRKSQEEVILLDHEALDWLLRGLDIQALKPHQILSFERAF